MVLQSFLGGYQMLQPATGQPPWPQVIHPSRPFLSGLGLLLPLFPYQAFVINFCCPLLERLLVQVLALCQSSAQITFPLGIVRSVLYTQPLFLILLLHFVPPKSKVHVRNMNDYLYVYLPTTSSHHVSSRMQGLDPIFFFFFELTKALTLYIEHSKSGKYWIKLNCLKFSLRCK